ncbi:UDP-glucose 4-epimerase GalE [Armatimonadetes bacterium Uphvl-Ar1]|nr:UDP-glucose 4-epimerase GalE [Armatimonadetes bacterium Uphvl-Ar1]
MILVCGGAGYIGSHMAKRLRQEGVDHVIFDNLERGNEAAIGGSQFFRGDLRNRDDVAAVFEQFDIHLVMHFAAYIEVGESVKEPAKFWENNVTAVWNLLEECRVRGVEQVVFSSTAAVYGEPSVVPIPENHPKNPTNPYGDTKLAVERMLAGYGRAYGLRSVCLRYFNACGSDPEGELGEDHRPETHLIPRILLAAAGRAPEITVFGTDYDTQDGTCIRDYVHVWDLADAHLRAVRYLEAGGASDQFNLGSGNGFSVREVLDAVRSVTGVNFPVSYGDRREGDPARLVADSTRARSVLGWSPEFDDVAVCVIHAWEWMVAHPGGYESR